MLMVMYDNCYGSEPKGIFVDLTYDSGFKAVFADEANKTPLIGLLNIPYSSRSILWLS